MDLYRMGYHMGRYNYEYKDKKTLKKFLEGHSKEWIRGFIKGLKDRGIDVDYNEVEFLTEYYVLLGDGCIGLVKSKKPVGRIKAVLDKWKTVKEHKGVIKISVLRPSFLKEYLKPVFEVKV